jgi:hypothetical protein
MTTHGILGTVAFTGLTVSILSIFAATAPSATHAPTMPAPDATPPHTDASDEVHTPLPAWESPDNASFTLSDGRTLYGSPEGLFLFDPTHDQPTLLASYGSLVERVGAPTADAPIGNFVANAHEHTFLFTIAKRHDHTNVPALFRLKLDPLSIKSYELEDPLYTTVRAIRDDGTRAVLTGASCPCAHQLIILDLESGEQLLSDLFHSAVWNDDLDALVVGQELGTYHVGSDTHAQIFAHLVVNESGIAASTTLFSDTTTHKHGSIRWISPTELSVEQFTFAIPIPLSRFNLPVDDISRNREAMDEATRTTLLFDIPTRTFRTESSDMDE